MRLKKRLQNNFKDIKCSKYLNTKVKNQKPTIVFICQCQHIWDKEKYLVEKLFLSDNFNIVIYICPEDNKIDNTIFEEFAIENSIQYVKHQNGKLKSLNPDIIIYSRPYDFYLPEEVRSYNTKLYAVLGYIPYGYSLMELGETCLNRLFTQNISLFFADCEYSYQYFCAQHKRNIKKGYQKAYFIGYPYLEDLKNNKSKYLNNPSMFSNFDNKKINVIWTPRWTNNDKLGGSNFLRYFDPLFNLLINNEEYNFTFRPHPYALKEFVSKGILTENKKNDYLKRLQSSNNSVYDDSNFYLSTFNESDVLITDISSIIAEFMIISDKPIIFCHNEQNEILNHFCIECCKNVFYNAYSFNDIKAILDNLKKGIDPMKEKRIEFNNKFRNSFNNSCQNIENELLKLSNKI